MWLTAIKGTTRKEEYMSRRAYRVLISKVENSDEDKRCPMPDSTNRQTTARVKGNNYNDRPL